LIPSFYYQLQQLLLPVTTATLISSNSSAAITTAIAIFYIKQSQRAHSSACFNSLDDQTGCSLPLTLHARVTNAIIGSTAPEY
jgi:hypothetical protein